jgi:fibronectin type 3 domain-containing protein
VQTVDYNGIVSKTLAIAFITTQSNKPTPPAGIKGFASEGKVYLQWGEILNAEGLQVKIYRYQRGNKASVIKTLQVKDTQYTDTTVKKGELYFYYIASVDSRNIESTPSAELSIRVD